MAEHGDLVSSIVTAKHLDFFKAQPLTKFKPGVVDDGMLQRMDAPFLEAFLNPSVSGQFVKRVYLRTSTPIGSHQPIHKKNEQPVMCCFDSKHHLSNQEENATVQRGPAILAHNSNRERATMHATLRTRTRLTTRFSRRCLLRRFSRFHTKIPEAHQPVIRRS